MSKYANRRDHNQATIGRHLEGRGAVVVDTSRVGGGFPDLVVGYRGRNHLIETKNPATAYGRRGLNKNQQNFDRRWTGEPLDVARTVEEADALMDRWEEE